MGRQEERNKKKHIKKTFGSKNTELIVSAANKKIIKDEVDRINSITQEILAEVFQEVMRNNHISIERSNKMVDEIFEITKMRTSNII